MNILMIGQNDPAGMMIAFANALNRYTEHTARVISFRSLYAMDYEFDIELPRINEDFSEIEHLLKSSDVFHFHMLMDENYQIGPLQIKDYLKGKALLHHHHGTYDHQTFLALASDYNEKYKKLKRRAIVSTPDLLKLLPVATWQPNLVPLDDTDLQPRFDHQVAPKKLNIVQAPTRKWHKQTAEFLRACERLKFKYPQIDCKLLENMTYRQCLKAKRNSHICFDHMNGWFGISSLESLAQGVPVIAGLDDWNIQAIQEFTGVADIPWVVARNESELEVELEKLIKDDELRVSIGVRSRNYLESYWTEHHALSVLQRTYQEL
jgi:glycosyltransferase involved in cell wall biosynthesis